MGLTASLSSTELQVTPGQEASCELVLRNTGQVVDQFTVEMVGETTGWTVLDPPIVNLYPGASGAVRVTFRPPRGPGALAGVRPFGVRISSREDPAASRVEEGSVEVAVVDDLTAELVPRVASGRRRARCELAVDNRGNRPVTLDLFAEDPADALRFGFRQPSISAEPGTATLVRMRVRAKHGFWRGPEKTLPFHVVGQRTDGQAAGADGAMVQKPLLPAWLVPALAAVAALVAVFAVLWATLLRPAITSTAKAEANKQAQALASSAQQAQRVADQMAAQQSAAASGGGAGGSSGGAAGSGSGAGAAGTGGTGGTGGATPKSPVATPSKPGTVVLPPLPTSFEVQTSEPAADPAGSYGTFTEPGQSSKPLSVSDIVFQNPAGDHGTLQIRRNGQVLLEVGLDNFRDLDYHFLVPWEFAKGDSLIVAVSCQNPKTACSPAVSFSGLAG
jgi:type II secretory pathway pseudopilin PulG